VRVSVHAAGCTSCFCWAAEHDQGRGLGAALSAYRPRTRWVSQHQWSGMMARGHQVEQIKAQTL
jgi:hypothetical protein